MPVADRQPQRDMRGDPQFIGESQIGHTPMGSELGLKTGDSIAIFMENNPHFLAIAWAAQRSGLYYACISSRLTAGEVEYIVKDSGAKVLISSAYLARTAAEFERTVDELRDAIAARKGK